MSIPFQNAVYDKTRQEENEPESRNMALQFLEQHGFELYGSLDVEKFKEYDFIVRRRCDQKLFPIEVERKNSGWYSKKMPFHETHIPYRKKESKASLFVMVNAKDASVPALVITRMDHIPSSPVIIKDTIHQKNEPFFEYPTSKFLHFWYDKQNGWIQHRYSVMDEDLDDLMYGM